MATTPAPQPSARGNVFTSDGVVPRVSLPSLLAGDLDQHYPQFRHLFAVTPSTAAGESDQVRLAMVACFQQRKWQYYRIVGTRTRFRHDNVPGLALRSLINFRCLTFVLKVVVEVVVMLVV